MPNRLTATVVADDSSGRLHFRAAEYAPDGTFRRWLTYEGCQADQSGKSTPLSESDARERISEADEGLVCERCGPSIDDFLAGAP